MPSSDEEPSIAEHVRELVEADLFLREALARDIVNFRGLARWLMAEHSVEGAIETIVSGLRRYEPGKPVDLAPAREVLEGAPLQTRSGVTALVLPREPTCRRLKEVLDAVRMETRERLRIIQTSSKITVVVDDANLEAVREALGDDLIEREVGNLSELEIVAPGEGIDMPGVLGLVFIALMVRGISVRFAMSGYPEQLVFVDRQDSVAAYQAISDLVESTENPQ